MKIDIYWPCDRHSKFGRYLPLCALEVLRRQAGTFDTLAAGAKNSCKGNPLDTRYADLNTSVRVELFQVVGDTSHEASTQRAIHYAMIVGM